MAKSKAVNKQFINLTSLIILAVLKQFLNLLCTAEHMEVTL